MITASKGHSFKTLGISQVLPVQCDEKDKDLKRLPSALKSYVLTELRRIFLLKSATDSDQNSDTNKLDLAIFDKTEKFKMRMHIEVIPDELL